jgi:quinol monooxygenase YgiN
MILIIGKGQLLPERRDQALAAATTMSEASRGEAGCHDYRFWTSISDPNLMMVLEEWEDQAALDAHFRTPHLKEFAEALTRTLDGSLEVIKYEIASHGSLL